MKHELRTNDTFICFISLLGKQLKIIREKLPIKIPKAAYETYRSIWHIIDYLLG